MGCADSCTLADMARISVRVEKCRVLIPADIRRKLGLMEGKSDLLLDIDETPSRATTRAQALVRLQSAAARCGNPEELWSEELMMDRRREAEGEGGN